MEVAEKLELIEKTSSKLEKTYIIIDMLKSTTIEEAQYLILFLLGRIFPEYITKDLGINQNLLIKALSKAYGYDAKDIEKAFKEKGDMGKVAEEISLKSRQYSLITSSLTLRDVVNTLRIVSSIEGEGSIDRKITYISSLFMRCRGKDAKYLARYILGDMRIGVAEGIIRDAVIGAYFTQFYWTSLFDAQMKEEIIIKYWKNKNILLTKEAELANGKIATLAKKVAGEVEIISEKEIEKIESFHYAKLKKDIVLISSQELGNLLREKYTKLVDIGYALINDFPLIAKICYEEGEEGLKKIKPILFRPIKVMLAQRAHDVAEAFSIVGKPAAFEYKFDGFRVQIHKKGEEIKIYTRRLEDVTAQFPDIVEVIKENLNAEEFIIEGEAVGYDKETAKFLPFQKISQRIKRKYNIEKMTKEIPVKVYLFDIIYLNGEKIINEKFSERRKILESIVKNKEMLAAQIITDKEKNAEEFYKEALEKGNEGIMAKNLNAVYEPGLRVGNMIKIKPTLESLDLVIIGAEWGEGKRAGYLSSFEVACIDEDTGEFLTIGKIGTGIKEKASEGGVSFEELTERLKSYIEKEEGKKVKIKPTLVVEVAYEEIQKSPHYSSGFALRFPRLIRIRDDKSPQEADKLSRIWKIYKDQRGRGRGIPY